MKIIHMTAEMAPFAKAGGLGDVIYGLGNAQAKKKEDLITVVLPKYESLDLSSLTSLRILIHDLMVPFEHQWTHTTVWEGNLGLIRIILIESQDPAEFFQREKIYGYPDDIERFAYFCCAAFEFIKTDTPPDIVHIHEWQTALLAPFLKTNSFSSKIVFTIHNLSYQGICDPSLLDKINLSPSINLQDDEQPHLLNLLKGAIIYSDIITTVSPTYSQEILSPQEGNGLYKVLQKEQDKIDGILNGIDFDYWNPKKDTYLPFHYSLDNLIPFPPFLAKKAKIKNHLQKILFMEEEEETPMIGVITRLVAQKGPELIKEALLYTFEAGGQFLLLGSTFDPFHHEMFYALKRKFAGSRRVHIELSYNESLAHLIYAASDLILIPSIFEPCGLTQMIAMRYGTVPLARETGGLKDTIFDLHHSIRPLSKRNGFTFLKPEKEDLLNALNRALETWRSHPQEWHKLIEVGMQTDFSWDRPAAQYKDLYNSLLVSKK